MNTLRAFLSVVVSMLALASANGATSKPLTWLEHREAAKAGLRFRIADPVTPVQHLERALDLARQQGVSAAEIGDLMDQLAVARDTYGTSSEDWERLLLETLRYKEQNLGAQAPELVPTLRHLSTLRFRQQRNLESLELLARAQSIQVRHFGARSAPVAEGYTLLGATLEGLGDFEQAEIMYRKAAQIVRELPNPPAEIHFAVLVNLAELLRTQGGHPDEVEALDIELAPAREQVIKKDEEEAAYFAHLPRLPEQPDVNVLSDEEVAARAAAGLILVDPVQREVP